jgi:hypothetical protein
MCVLLGMNVGMDMTDAGVFVEVLMRRRVHGPRVVAHDVLHKSVTEFLVWRRERGLPIRGEWP